ncbi:MAG TPA: hypothetical protein VEO01_33335 [Pseudonocardiaceae bacterium]|nr:hypothetical protein [Pseudonocardiaceae bacterium]
MKHGSLPRSIARSLPAEKVEPAHAPDGIAESDIDALIAETGIDLGPEPPTDDDDQPLGQVIPLHPTRELRATPLDDEAA